MTIGMTIGQLARRVGLRPSAIRCYEAHGILGPPERAANAYRLYGSEAVALLRFVRRAKELGFNLEEVRQIIERLKNEPPCVLSRKLVERHLVELKEELRRMRSLRDRLRRFLVQEADRTTGAVCPLIEG